MMAEFQRVQPMAHGLSSTRGSSQSSKSDDVYEVRGMNHSLQKTSKNQSYDSSAQESPQDDEIFFQLTKEETSEYDTSLSKLVTKFKLPTVAKVQTDFSVAKKGLFLKKGERLLLHFIGQQRRIPAKDDFGKKTWLFFDDQQLYDILPHDPHLDFKQFYGTDAVVKNTPLPRRLRIVKMSPRYKQEHGLEVGDILDISHVESRPQEYKAVDLLVLIGSCNGKQFSLTQHTTDIIYSTMISKENMPLSTVFKRNLCPVRVRQIADNRVYSLLREPVGIELQVIATRMGHDRVLALPLSCPIQVERNITDDVEELLKGLLPAVYSLVHYTGRVLRVEPKPSKGPKPLTKPAVSPLTRSHSSKDSGQESRLRSSRSRDWPNATPPLQPKPKLATRSQSFMTPRPRPKEPPPIYDDAPCLNISNSEPEETKLVYDDVSVLVNTTPKPAQPVFDDTSDPASLRPEADETQPIYDDTAILDSSTGKPEAQPIYDDASTLVNSVPKTGEEQPIYDDASSFLIPLRPGLEGKYPVYDDASTSVVPDWKNKSPLSDRKSRPRFGHNHPRHGMGEDSLRSASVDEVGDFLREHHFESWIDQFRAASIDGEVLCKVDHYYLSREMNMRTIEAKRLVLVVKKATSQSQ